MKQTFGAKVSVDSRGKSLQTLEIITIQTLEVITIQTFKPKLFADFREKIKYEDIHGLDWVYRQIISLGTERVWVSGNTVRSSLFRQILGF